jgi:hypothetical protein
MPALAQTTSQRQLPRVCLGVVEWWAGLSGCRMLPGEKRELSARKRAYRDGQVWPPPRPAAGSARSKYCRPQVGDIMPAAAAQQRHQQAAGQVLVEGVVDGPGR